MSGHQGAAAQARMPTPRAAPAPYPDWGSAATALEEFFRTAGIVVRNTGTHQTGVTTFAFTPALRLPVDEAMFLAQHATRIEFVEAPASIRRYRDEHPGGTLCLVMIGLGWDDYYYDPAH
ncbi:MAG: hypothetical protein ACR2JI_03225 [Mycobacterium sp.]